MKRFSHKLTLFGVLLGIVTLTFSVGASAHVIVKPAEVLSAAFQTFTVRVPNEKDVATTSVKLMIPAGLKNVQPTQMNPQQPNNPTCTFCRFETAGGWQIKVDKTGSGQNAVVKSITWSGQIQPGFREDFTFAAQVPDKTGEINWKAYQTYADGTVVSWDKATGSSEGSNSGPFSITKVVSETAADVAVSKANQAAADAKNAANTALYVAIAGVAVGLVGVYFGTRKK